MISIIICSKSHKHVTSIAENIATTVGVAYELIIVDNSQNTYSICSAYNTGAEKAIYNYLCFVHEDVNFVTQNWGHEVIAHFKNDPSTGLIGVAGAVYKPKMVSGWGHSEVGWAEHKRINISHSAGSSLKKIYINPFAEKKSSVVCIDGVFMVTEKKTWEENKFDEKLLTGFHGYDLDFSLQILQSKKIYVVYNIFLEHYSGGKYNSVWLEELIKVHQKWKTHLPAVIKGYHINSSLVYSDGWKRIRKNMRLYVTKTTKLSKLFKIYHTLFLQLENLPFSGILLKDYTINLFKIIKLSRQ